MPSIPTQRYPTFPELFWSRVNADTTTDRIALCVGEQEISYRLLGDRVKRRMHAFAASGIVRGDRIALLQDRTIQQCVDIVAALCFGVSVTVLNKSDSAANSCQKLDAISVSLLIADEANIAIAKTIADRSRIQLGDATDNQVPNDVPLTEPAVPLASGDAMVLFTSGSTGVPKGVAISQANIASNIHGVSSAVPVSFEDHYLQVMPLSHTNGLQNQVLLPLAVGARVTLLSHFEADYFLSAMAEYQPTIVTCVPTMLSRLLEKPIPAEATENLRFIRTGAAPIQPEVQQRVEAHFGTQVVVSYGQSEVTCTNTANPPGNRKIGSVGRVLDGQELAILSLSGEDILPAGEIGEVCFRGTSIAIGLIGSDPFDPTAWFRTGDCGYVDAEGFLFLTGRLKDIIIRGGANLSPRQIESVLLRSDAVHAVSVIGWPDGDLGEVPIACIEPSGILPVDLSKLNKILSESLTRAHQLRDIVEFHRLPLNEIGKVDKQALATYVKQCLQNRIDFDKNIRCQDHEPLAYINRTRRYYTALGFGKPYEWDNNTDTPFCLLAKPLEKSVVAIVTTAAPYQADKGDQGPGALYNAGAKFYTVYSGSTESVPDLCISHVGIDRDNTTAADIGSYFPLAALKKAVDTGRVGAVAEHFYGLPTNRSKRVTKTVDCEALLSAVQSDNIDAVILVPNCPVCHQSTTLAARALESAGIPTVVMGCAKDIVETVGAPRFLFSDFPLGNSAGRPHDPQSQDIALNSALDLLESAKAPGALSQSPLKWIGKPNWKSLYSNPDLLSSEEIASRKAKFEEGKRIAKNIRQSADVGINKPT
jgi:acyl-CoA synthetase (AMP-forming)/AMP-acid ligase II